MQPIEWVYDSTGHTGYAVPTGMTPEQFIEQEAGSGRTRSLRPPRHETLPFQFNDGGRAAAGFQGTTGDCSVRAIAIATQRPYRNVYDELNMREKERASNARKHTKRRYARTGVPIEVVREYLADAGWEWVPTMGIGSGCTVHLRANELPPGRVIVRVSSHLTAVIDGMLCDTFDCSRGGSCCVYGLWRSPERKPV